jgi:peptide/nickel transport system ATP-binding protein
MSGGNQRMRHLLEVNNLRTQFKVEGRINRAVDNVSYYIDEGEIVAFVGESGSGKSVTQYSGLQLIPSPPGKITAGTVIYEGENLLAYDARSVKMREIRGGKIGVVFQEPMTSLNPVLTIGRQIEESVAFHLKFSKAQARERAVELLNAVGIPDAARRLDDYPHQFSGGMRQRIMIAMALSCNPKILIADEATTALDVTTQAQILELLRGIVKKTNTSLIIVTHNLGIVARYADRIYVMYAGEIVETGTTKELFVNPRHPYTAGLLKAIPSLTEPKGQKLVPIEGITPSLIEKRERCAFLPRCTYCEAQCSRAAAPQLRPVPRTDGHYVACLIDFRQNLKENSQPPAERGRLGRMAAGSESGSTGPLLQVENLKIYFSVTKGFLKRKIGDIKAVDDVSFELRRGETLGLVGESGCGKTTVARSVLRLYEPSAGRIVFEGQDITKMTLNSLRTIRRNMSLIFQDPYSSLDPRQKAEDIVGEPLRNYRLFSTETDYRDRVDELFRLVGLDPSVRERVPHEFSGGQRQRLGIARALASNPSFIVCDEAISALDVSIQAQIINLLEELQVELGLTYLFIAHDLSVVRHISDRVAVMYLGKIVEIADWKALYETPLHPYTQALLDAVPVPDPFTEEKREKKTIKGEVPSLMNRPKGCVFSNRCPIATSECSEIEPALAVSENGHGVACLKR